MPVVVIISVVVIFALTMLSVSVGLKFFEARRKSQMTGILKTATGTQEVASNLLKDATEEDGLFSTAGFAKKMQAQIQEAGMNWTAGRLFGFMALMAIPGLGIGTVAPFILNGWVTSLTLGAVGACMPYMYMRSRRKKRLARLEEQFPEALDFLARSMRAGHAFSISLEMIGDELEDPLGQEFRALFNEQNLGAPLDICLRNFSQRVPLLDARFFASSVLLQKQTGGNLSEILSRLAYVIRERFRLKGQVKAASAHGRLTATILTVLPVVTMLALLAVAPGYLQGMAADPDGKWLIGGAIFAQVLGNIFIKKIINIKV
jgi:tight adherence protein B